MTDVAGQRRRGGGGVAPAAQPSRAARLPAQLATAAAARHNSRHHSRHHSRRDRRRPLPPPPPPLPGCSPRLAAAFVVCRKRGAVGALCGGGALRAVQGDRGMEAGWRPQARCPWIYGAATASVHDAYGLGRDWVQPDPSLAASISPASPYHRLPSSPTSATISPSLALPSTSCHRFVYEQSSGECNYMTVMDAVTVCLHARVTLSQAKWKVQTNSSNACAQMAPLSRQESPLTVEGSRRVDGAGPRHPGWCAPLEVVFAGSRDAPSGLRPAVAAWSPGGGAVVTAARDAPPRQRQLVSSSREGGGAIAAIVCLCRGGRP